MNAVVSFVLSLKQGKMIKLYSSDLKSVYNYLANFEVHEEVRAIYKPQIEKFLHEEQNFINSFETEGNKKGKIMITILDDNRVIRALPIIYKEEKKLLDEKYAFKLFKQAMLRDPENLRKLVIEKGYLLSKFEIMEINRALKIGNPRGYIVVVNMLINDFKKHEEPFYYLMSLLNLYRDELKIEEKKEEEIKKNDLPKELQTAVGVVSNINQQVIADTIKEERQLSFFEELGLPESTEGGTRRKK